MNSSISKQGAISIRCSEKNDIGTLALVRLKMQGSKWVADKIRLPLLSVQPVWPFCQFGDRLGSPHKKELPPEASIRNFPGGIEGNLSYSPMPHKENFTSRIIFSTIVHGWSGDYAGFLILQTAQLSGLLNSGQGALRFGIVLAKEVMPSHKASPVFRHAG